MTTPLEDRLNPDAVLKLCHDLRGPLGAIGTWAHVLGDDRADEATRRRALASMAKDLRELKELIEGLTDSRSPDPLEGSGE